MSPTKQRKLKFRWVRHSQKNRLTVAPRTHEMNRFTAGESSLCVNCFYSLKLRYSLSFNMTLKKLRRSMIKFLSDLIFIFPFCLSDVQKQNRKKKSNHVRYKVTLKRGLLKTVIWCLLGLSWSVDNSLPVSWTSLNHGNSKWCLNNPQHRHALCQLSTSEMKKQQEAEQYLQLQI